VNRNGLARDLTVSGVSAVWVAVERAERNARAKTEPVGSALRRNLSLLATSPV